MPYLIVRTEVRQMDSEQVINAWSEGSRIRDEQTSPEPWHQTVCADDRDSALTLARSLAAVGAVRSGRHRIKVVRLPDVAPEAA